MSGEAEGKKISSGGQSTISTQNTSQIFVCHVRFNCSSFFCFFPRKDWKSSVHFLAWGISHHSYKILCYFIPSGNTPNYKPKYLKKDENGKKNKTRERNNELETEFVSRFFLFVYFVYRNYFFFAGSSHHRFCVS